MITHALLKLVIIFCLVLPIELSAQKTTSFFEADHPLIQYTGRIDFSNPKKPKFWQPGVYIQAKFKGTFCEIVVNDEVLWGNSHNYITIVIDNGIPIRLKVKSHSNTIMAAQGLHEGEHTITICKGTESGIGYLEFVGLKCDALLPSTKPQRKLEFIGNSITCGMGADLSEVPCDSAQWYDQHNAYQSYGPTVARALNAQWHLSSVSGIGMIRSCCDMDITMPGVFDKINMRENKMAWDFKQYQPDAVTIMLGQNDGKQDSVAFCSVYVNFISSVRKQYPKAHIVCLTSPMANDTLRAMMKNYLNGIVQHVNKRDKKVNKFFFSRSWNNGCGEHPDLNDHQLIAAELEGYLKTLLKW